MPDRKKHLRTHTRSQWQLNTVVWHDAPFTFLALYVLQLLSAEAHERRRKQRAFAKDELVIVVCSAIRRVVGAFQVVLGALFQDATVLARYDLEETHLENIQARLPGDLTGPSAAYAIMVRHPRFRARSQAEWQDAGPQHNGRQTISELNCIMGSQPEKGLFIFLHYELRRGGPTSASGGREIQLKQELEGNRRLRVTR